MLSSPSRTLQAETSQVEWARVKSIAPPEIAHEEPQTVALDRQAGRRPAAACHTHSICEGEQQGQPAFGEGERGCQIRSDLFIP